MGIRKEVNAGIREAISARLVAGEKQAELAKRYGLSKQYVHWLAKKLKMTDPLAQRRQRKQEEKERLAKEIRVLAGSQPDISVREIADLLRVPPVQVRKALGLETASKHGGKRAGAGRPREIKEKKMRLNATITERQYGLLAEAGDGNPYRGLEIAIARLP